MTRIVHTVSDVVDVASVPRLVVVGGATRLLEELTVVLEDSVTDRAIRLIDQLDELLDGEVVQCE